MLTRCKMSGLSNYQRLEHESMMFLLLWWGCTNLSLSGLEGNNVGQSNAHG